MSDLFDKRLRQRAIFRLMTVLGRHDLSHRYNDNVLFELRPRYHFTDLNNSKHISRLSIQVYLVLYGEDPARLIKTVGI